MAGSSSAERRYFAGRVQGFYILDFPRVAEAMWNLLKGQMPQKTVESVRAIVDVSQSRLRAEGLLSLI